MQCLLRLARVGGGGGRGAAAPLVRAHAHSTAPSAPPHYRALPSSPRLTFSSSSASRGGGSAAVRSREPSQPPASSPPRARLHPALVVLLLLGLAGLGYSLADNDFFLWVFQSRINFHLTAFAAPSTSPEERALSAKRLATFASSYRFCQALVEKNVLARCLTALSLVDVTNVTHVELKRSVAEIFYYVSSFEGLNDNLLVEELLQQLHVLSRDADGASRRFATHSLALLIVSGSEPVVVLGTVGFDPLTAITDEALFLRVHTRVKTLAQQRDLGGCERSSGELMRFLEAGLSAGISLHQALALYANFLLAPDTQDDSAQVALTFLQRWVHWVHVPAHRPPPAQPTVADVPLPPSYASAAAAAADDDARPPSSLVQTPLHEADAQLQEEIEAMRVIANLSADLRFKDTLLHSHVLPRILNASLRETGSRKLRLASMLTLANLSLSEECATYFVAVGHHKLLAKLLLTEHFTHELIETQLASLFAHLCQHETLRQFMWVPEFQAALWLLTARPYRLTRTNSLTALIHLAGDSKISARLVRRAEFIEKLTEWLVDPDTDVQTRALSLLANIAVHEPVAVNSIPLLPELLDQPLRSQDVRLRQEALRTKASLADLHIKAPKYAEGVYLLHPELGQPEQDQSVDIVFIHGVTGHYLTTWRGGIVDPNDEDGHISWPRDWLPHDFPRARIISIGYDAHLTRWGGGGNSLEQQSMIILEKLRLAALGKKPMVFVTHSFGGLLLKYMLRYCASHPDYAPLLAQTKGVVFYSTPHFGSQLEYIHNDLTHFLLRANPINADLTPSPKLTQLNADFDAIAQQRRIPTLSFGEGLTSGLTIVGDESANPQLSGSHHAYIATDFTHRDVCKPDDRRDLRYTLIVDFITQLLASS